MLSVALSSLVIIVILHYVFVFLRDSLTAPRVRDLVHRPVRKRDRILALASSPPAESPKPSIQPEAESEMKAELGAFLRQLQSTSPPSLGAKPT